MPPPLNHAQIHKASSSGAGRKEAAGKRRIKCKKKLKVKLTPLSDCFRHAIRRKRSLSHAHDPNQMW